MPVIARMGLSSIQPPRRRRFLPDLEGRVSRAVLLMKSVTIRFKEIGDFTREWIEQNEEKSQEIFKRAKGQRPSCMCRPAGIPMYLAHYKKFFLKKMPNTGPDHAPHCPSFEPDPGLTGRGIYSKIAATEKPDGRLSIKAAVPILIRAATGDSNPPQVSPSPGNPNAQKDEFKLTGVLHLLWERAGFNRWAPKMKNRRHYNQIYKFIYEAASLIILRRNPIKSYLYIPEPFKPDLVHEIDARRQRIFKTLTRTSHNEPKRMMVLGEIRDFISGEEGLGIHLGHTPKTLTFWCDNKMSTKVEKIIAFATPDWPSVNPLLKIITLMTVEKHEKSKWIVHDITAMVTNKNYIPITSLHEATLTDHLIENDRYFYKPLNYDSKGTGFANFLLTDTGDSPVPLEIFQLDKGAATASQNMRIAEYEENNEKYWQWDVNTETGPPALP